MTRKLFDVRIKSNLEVAEKIFKLVIDAPELSQNAKAGQFVQVKIADELTLRRPLGIASTRDDCVTIFYRVVGRGTEILSSKQVGECLNVLGALGNSFETETDKKILLVGGGMGLAPLLSCAEKLVDVDVLIGGKNRGEVEFWVKEFRPNVGKIFITTDDGSFGSLGFVTGILPEVFEYGEYTAVYTCGPEVMMRGVYKIARAENIPCKVSFERRMACGLGACLSCSIDTVNGRKKVCKDGSIFDAREVFELA